jgi:hypothetical protein
MKIIKIALANGLLINSANAKFMRSLIFLLISVILLAKGKAESQHDIYVKDVFNQVVSLNGTWKICLTPSGKFRDINQFEENWKDIQLPGKYMMQIM